MHIESVQIFPAHEAIETGRFRTFPNMPVPASGEILGDYFKNIADSNLTLSEFINSLGKLYGENEIDFYFQTNNRNLEKIVSYDDDAIAICKNNPHLWNVLCYEKEWATYPEYNDFMEKASPVHHKKLFQWEIYRQLMRGIFPDMGKDKNILDVGGGVGRSAVPLSMEGHSVTLTDASPAALKTAWKHLSTLKIPSPDFDLVWTDAVDLSMFKDNSFDMGLALEVFCYHSAPEKCLCELVRCIKPGGRIFFSVENLSGALIADRSFNAANVIEAITNRSLFVENEIYVKYFSRAQLRKMSKKAGLTNINAVGCQYVADGPAGLFLPDSVYKNTSKIVRLKQLEEILRELDSPAIPPRAWLVSGIVE